MLYITPVPALNDNYIWLIVHLRSGNCLIIDPGEATAVIETLTPYQWHPVAILLTHHHADHCAGAPTLADYYHIPVFGPRVENISAVTNPLSGNESVVFDTLNLQLQVLSIPGHTRGHLAYYSNSNHILFCGDTLFTGACGRLFEGTAEQMFNSLSRLAALPDNTLIYCGHEYTLNNLIFAATLEPDNQTLQQRITHTRQLRNRGLPTVPSTLGLEKRTNPFLRSHEPTVIQACTKITGNLPVSPTEVFATIRAHKDGFKIN